MHHRIIPILLTLSLTGVTTARDAGEEFPPVGSAAPAFELVDTEGKTRVLEDVEGKIVVLEWTNHECPAVNGAHDKQAIARTRKAVGENVVWWMVDSSHFCEEKLDAIRDWRRGRKLDVPYLLDPAGKVGRAFHATSTPQLFVIDGKGRLVYAGGIEDRSKPEGERVNFVAAAVAALRAGTDVSPSTTAAPGCSVKYAKAPVEVPATVAAAKATAEAKGGDWVCPPCGAKCHDESYSESGACPVCGMELVRANSLRKVAIVLWDGVELLDFAGPGEVFSATRGPDGSAFEVYTVTSDGKPITSQGFVKVDPSYSLASAPDPDIIVLPGGGVGEASKDEVLMAWIAKHGRSSEHVLSVCTGAFLLASPGILDGLAATTWYGAVEGLEKLATKTVVHRGRRFVDNGRVITSAGVSAGIDASLHLVERLFDDATARRTAQYMEYDWRPELYHKALEAA
jgi:putative intracellular protease/amidase/peroxiredoxin